MKKPDSSNHNPDPHYLRGLLDAAGISQRRAAELLGITDRAMRYYLSDETSESFRPAPYPVQFSLESLAHHDMSERLLAALNELMRYAPGRYADDPRPDSEIDAGREAAFAEAQRIIDICERGHLATD